MKSVCSKMLSFVLASLLLLSSFGNYAYGETANVSSAPIRSASGNCGGMVRVYLASISSVSTLNVTVRGNYSIGASGPSIASGSKVSARFSSTNGNISLSFSGTTYNAGKEITICRHSAEGTNGLLISEAKESENLYPGDLTLKAVSSGNGYSLYVIVSVFIEDYLYGVLPYEMGNSTSIEALKAQAVAARTYTYRMMLNRSSSLYDVKDTTADQVYRGTPSGNANCVSAVNATKGIVLMYGSECIVTYYSASNGGQTESYRSGSGYPYLVVKDDPFDYANTASVVKTKTLSSDLTSSQIPSGFLALIQSKAVSSLRQSGYLSTTSNTVPITLTSVRLHTPKYASPSRLYTKADCSFTVSTVSSSGNTVTTSVTVTCDIFNELESLLGLSIQSLQNELWTVEKSGSSFILEARRYGHGMGMSQRGAMYMAKIGYTYDEILGFYYDGCCRVRLTFVSSVYHSSSSQKLETAETPAEEEETDQCKGIVSLESQTSLIVRNAKSLSSQQIGLVPNGASLQVLSSDGEWCCITYGGLSGYVPASSLVIKGTPSGTETVSSALGFAAVTANDYVNLRSGPSLSYSILTTAPSGALLTVFSVNGSWAKVQYQKQVAYVNMQYISSLSSTASITVSEEEARSSDTSALRNVQSVPLYSEASFDSVILAILTPESAFSLVSEEGAWCTVQLGELFGFCPSDSFRSFENKKDNDAGYQTALVNTPGGPLNMRSGPSAGSAILLTVPQYATVELLQTGETWSQIRYASTIGYSMTCYLSFVSSDGIGQDNEQSAPEANMTALVVTSQGSLNLRALPRTGTAILLRIPRLSLVSVEEMLGEWWKITYQGVTGYASSAFLSLQDNSLSYETESGETPIDEEEPPNEIETELEDDVDIISDEEPLEKEEPVELILTAIVSTSSGSLNLRSFPTRGSAVLITIPKGMKISILQRYDEWSQTEYGGFEGYVMNQYLSFVETAVSGSSDDQKDMNTPNQQIAVVNTPSGSLNLRSLPSFSAEILTRIPQNAIVTVLSESNQWYMIEYQSLKGYVSANYLRLLNTDSSSDSSAEITSQLETAEIGGERKKAKISNGAGSYAMHEDPDSSSNVILTIPSGSVVSVLEEGDSWCRVQYGDIAGYLLAARLDTGVSPRPESENAESSSEKTPKMENTSYTEKQTDVSETEADSRKTESTETVNDSAETQAMDLTLEIPDGPLFAVASPSNGSLRLYSACSKASASIGSIAESEQVEVILKGDTWCLIDYHGKQGYCLTKELTLLQ